jgi:hypothetical protein
MRKDFLKVLCERERIRHKERSLKTGGKINPHQDFEDFDSGPSRLSSSKHKQESRCSHIGKGQKTEYKKHNFNYHILDRWLEKQVGRAWDDVYSEFRAAFNHNTYVGNQFLRLRFLVEKNVVTIDGVPYESPRWGFPQRPVDGLYVDGDGILRYNKRERYTRPKPPVTRFDCTDDISYYYLEDGLWYLHEYRLHAPDDPYQIITYVAHTSYLSNGLVYIQSYPSPDLRAKYGLKTPGDKHIIRYRDVDPKHNKPIFVSKRQVDSAMQKKLTEMARQRS